MGGPKPAPEKPGGRKLEAVDRDLSRCKTPCGHSFTKLVRAYTVQAAAAGAGAGCGATPEYPVH